MAATASTAPNLALLNGKILRIDPHGTAPGQYSIPPSNPYASSGTARHEIWASGFRNPWRFSFDHATGDLIIADVGEDSSEEVDLAPASSGLGRGADFGWPACEGFAGNCPGATPPVFAYPHTDPGGDVAHGCAIIGGYVYRGTQIPELAGRYLYADLCTGELRSIKLGIPFAGDDRRRERARRPDRSAVVRRGRELQPVRHERQCGGQARRPAILRHSGPPEPDQVQEEAKKKTTRPRRRSTRRSARRSTRRRKRGSSRASDEKRRSGDFG